jgi:hypothetical protein
MTNLKVIDLCQVFNCSEIDVKGTKKASELAFWRRMYGQV